MLLNGADRCKLYLFHEGDDEWEVVREILPSECGFTESGGEWPGHVCVAGRQGSELAIGCCGVYVLNLSSGDLVQLSDARGALAMSEKYLVAGEIDHNGGAGRVQVYRKSSRGAFKRVHTVVSKKKSRKNFGEHVASHGERFVGEGGRAEIFEIDKTGKCKRLVDLTKGQEPLILMHDHFIDTNSWRMYEFAAP